MTATGDASAPVSLLDEIRAIPTGPGNTCTVRRFLDSMTPQQRAAIQAALDEGIEPVRVAKWLIAKGYSGIKETATRHLKGGCRCQTIL